MRLLDPMLPLDGGRSMSHPKIVAGKPIVNALPDERGGWATRFEAFLTRDARKFQQRANSTATIVRREWDRRWIFPSPKDQVETLAAMMPRELVQSDVFRTSAGIQALLARTTLFPVYASACAAAVTGSNLDSPAGPEYQFLYHALMTQIERLSPQEAAGAIRVTGLTRGAWQKGYKAYLDFMMGGGQRLARQALAISSLAFPPGTRTIHLGELYFPLERESTLVKRDGAKAEGAPTQYAIFPDTLLVPLAGFYGGPDTGPATFRRLMLENEPWFNDVLKRAGVDGPIEREYGRPLPGRMHLLHASLDGALHSQDWDARLAEVRLRLTANNIIEAIRLTFQSARLPDYLAAKNSFPALGVLEVGSDGE